MESNKFDKDHLCKSALSQQANVTGLHYINDSALHQRRNNFSKNILSKMEKIQFFYNIVHKLIIDIDNIKGFNYMIIKHECTSIVYSDMNKT